MANSKKSNNDKKQKSSANKVNDKKQYVENVEAKKEKNQAKADKKSTKVKKSKEKSSFTKGFKSELKKVSWPTGKQVVNNTIAVIFIVIVVTAVVFCLDLAFGAVNKYGIEGVKALVQTESTRDTVPP